MLPRYPAAFSPNHSCGVPSTLRELCRYYPDEHESDMVMDMMANIWSLLPIGIAMVNADYMSRGLGIEEEYRGVRYIGRVDQMSYYISGVVLRKVSSCSTVNLIGIGKTGRYVAKAVKSRMNMSNYTVNVHEISQPVSGSIGGASDEDIRSDAHTIFHTRGFKGQVLNDSVCARQFSKGVCRDDIQSIYRRLLSSSSTMADSNSEVMRSVGVTLREVMGDLAGRSAGGEDDNPATVDDLRKIYRCVAAVVRVIKDGGGGGDVGRNVDGMTRSAVSTSMQQYTTSMGATTQRIDCAITGESRNGAAGAGGYGQGAGRLGSVPEDGSATTIGGRRTPGKGAAAVGTVGGRRRRNVGSTPASEKVVPVTRESMDTEKSPPVSPPGPPALRMNLLPVTSVGTDGTRVSPSSTMAVGESAGNLPNISDSQDCDNSRAVVPDESGNTHNDVEE